MEDKSDEFNRGEGLVATLQKRVRRGDVQEREQVENVTKRLEKERAGLNEENRKLREKIKEKDGRIVTDAVKRRKRGWKRLNGRMKC